MHPDPKTFARQDNHTARIRARIMAIQALYQMEMAGTNLETVIAEFTASRYKIANEGKGLGKKARLFFHQIMTCSVENQTQIDRDLASCLIDSWQIARLDVTLRALFRAAIGEIAIMRDQPVRGVIDAYVEIANDFFSDSEPGFVNAVLDRLARFYGFYNLVAKASENHMAQEFTWIEKYFAPLAGQNPAAAGLRDDVAFLPHNTVICADAIIAGVHCFADDPPEFIARKALRVNISDIAAKGAVAENYLLVLALPQETSEEWVARFASGLGQDQKLYNLTLIGGDTVATSGPLMVAITMLGKTSKPALRRTGAKKGQIICVSGTIGDAAIGLQSHKRMLPDDFPAAMAQYCLDRYLLPRPRHFLGRLLAKWASAAIDVSDGLIADCEHLALRSQLRFVLDLAKIPLSPAARQALAQGAIDWPGLLGGGDDYEIIFTVAPEYESQIPALAQKGDCPIHKIGQTEQGQGVILLDQQKNPVALAKIGYSHF